MKKVASIDEYFSTLKGVQLEYSLTMRNLVHKAMPKAVECISYGMPSYKTADGKQYLVHFAAMKGHLGFYPTPEGVKKFARELQEYSTSKGCIRFPYDEALPKKLIMDICRFKYTGKKV